MSTTKNDGGPAFPYQGDAFKNAELGMSLRDWFAGQALPGLVAVCGGDTLVDDESREQLFARRAYAIADAMLEARK